MLTVKVFPCLKGNAGMSLLVVAVAGFNVKLRAKFKNDVSLKECFIDYSCLDHELSGMVAAVV